MSRRPRTEAGHDPPADRHRSDSRLADIVLGGQDGLVNVLGMVLGVAAATGSTRVVLVAGLAAGFAGSISMGGVAYTSTRAAGDLFKSEKAREYRHVERTPQIERQEVRDIYAAKGFEGELLERIVDTITADKDVWVAIMMSEEHHLTDVDRRTSFRAAAIVGGTSLLGSLLPLVPFLLLPVMTGAATSVALAAAILFALGVYKAKVTLGHPLKSGLELAMIGVASAVMGYGIGAILQVPAVP